MIYRGPSFLAFVIFGSTPTPSPSPVNIVSLFLSLPVCRLSSLLRGQGGNGEEPNHTNRKKVWPSINHSILSRYDNVLSMQCCQLTEISAGSLQRTEKCDQILGAVQKIYRCLELAAPKLHGEFCPPVSPTCFYDIAIYVSYSIL
jgi:hypothetical protein